MTLMLKAQYHIPKREAIRTGAGTRGVHPALRGRKLNILTK